MTTATGIAAILASGQPQGQVTVTGRITAVDRRTNAADASWAVVTITDDGLNAIDVELHPKTYAGLAIEPCLGDITAVTGRLCLPPDGEQIVIYGDRLDHVEL